MEQNREGQRNGGKADGVFSRIFRKLLPKTHFEWQEPVAFNRWKLGKSWTQKIIISFVGIVLGIGLTGIAADETGMEIPDWALLGAGVAVGVILVVIVWKVFPYLGQKVHAKENGIHRRRGKYVQVYKYEQMEVFRLRRENHGDDDFLLATVVMRERRFFKTGNLETGLPLDFPIRDFLAFLMERGVRVEAQTSPEENNAISIERKTTQT